MSNHPSLKKKHDTNLHVNKKVILALLLFVSFAISCESGNTRLYSVSYKKIKCDFKEYGFENLCEDEKDYLDTAGRSYPEYSSLAQLNRKVLQDITRKTQDVDVSTSVFFTRAIRDKKTSDLIAYVKKKEAEYQTQPPDYSKSGFTLVLVPGMFYKENPDVGADGRVIRAIASKIGLSTELIPVGSTTSVTKNAETICGYIEHTSHEKIIVASTSKGGADFKVAMGKCGHETYFKKVKGWYNIAGLLRGTFAVNALDDQPTEKWKMRFMFFLKGYDWQGLMQLRSGVNSLLDQDLFLPDHFVMINVIGTPLFRFVTPRARSYFLYLNRFGPNDGYVLLADTIIPGAYLYPVWRNDHYFAWGMPEQRIQALISFVIDHAEK